MSEESEEDYEEEEQTHEKVSNEMYEWANEVYGERCRVWELFYPCYS